MRSPRSFLACPQWLLVAGASPFITGLIFYLLFLQGSLVAQMRHKPNFACMRTVKKSCRHFYKVVFMASLIFISACTKHRCTYNYVFTKYDMSSAEYRKELIRQLSLTHLNDIEFYIADYCEKEDQQYLTVDMHCERFCASTLMNITSCEKLWQLKEMKGVTNISAGLKGVKIIIDSTSYDYEITLVDIDDIDD